MAMFLSKKCQIAIFLSKSRKRLFLHAGRLTFTHPEKQQKVHFESTIPDDFQNVLQTFKI
jgi:23S rRNA-/tRNA-specific pseudouridylate synthase